MHLYHSVTLFYTRKGSIDVKPYVVSTVRGTTSNTVQLEKLQSDRVKNVYYFIMRVRSNPISCTLLFSSSIVSLTLIVSKTISQTSAETVGLNFGMSVSNRFGQVFPSPDSIQESVLCFEHKAERPTCSMVSFSRLELVHQLDKSTQLFFREIL